MHTQRQLLELAKEKTGANYSALAEQLSLSRQALSQFKLGTPFPATLALKVAELTGLDPAYVLACVEYQRASRLEKSETLPVWKKIAEHFAKHGPTADKGLPPK